MNEGTIRRAESHSRTKKPSRCVHHCRDMSSGYSLLSVDSCWWNSGNCASTGTLMVRRRRWVLRDTAHLSCISEGRICRGEETRIRRQETGKTAKKLMGLKKRIHNEKTERGRRRRGGGMVVAENPGSRTGLISDLCSCCSPVLAQ